jgi:hypothetical protein
MTEITHTYDHIETYKTNTKRWFYFSNLMENGAVGAQDDLFVLWEKSTRLLLLVAIIACFEHLIVAKTLHQTINRATKQSSISDKMLQ